EVPLVGGFATSQGTTIPFGVNLTFMATKYSPNYSGLAGQNLTGNGYIESNPDTGYCNTILSVHDHDGISTLLLYPNPATDNLTIDLSINNKTINTISVCDALGKVLFEKGGVSTSRYSLNTANFDNGIYFVQVNESIPTKFIIAQ
ncbi:MAG: T9SS type A sorting domain-containing protein, partial [Bacteroidia bacterium]|nr:T9SS type A sorting domain-containing protein [Bacteroidia bacterium]